MNAITLTSLLAAACFTCATQAHAESYSRTRSVTGPQGKTATRTVDGSYGSGSFSRNVTSTGPNGNTSSHGRVVTKQPNGRDAQVTGPNGTTWNKSVRTGPYGHARAASITGPQGNTRRFVRIR